MAHDGRYTQVPMREPHGQIQQRVSYVSEEHIQTEVLPYLPAIVGSFQVILIAVSNIYQVVDGNTVIDAARMAQWKKVPAVVLDYPDQPPDVARPVWIMLDDAGDRVEPRETP